MGYKKIQAKLVLAILFFSHLLQRAVFFWRKPKGLPTFLSLFAGDAIFPVGADERALFPRFQRCQACSLCTFSCEPVQAGKAPAAFEPKMIMLGFGRSSHEAEAFLPEWIPCLECNECTIDCPNDVPIHAMANQIIERRKNVAFRR